MFHTRLDDSCDSDTSFPGSMKDDLRTGRKLQAVEGETIRDKGKLAHREPSLRRTPRHSLIVVLQENHLLSPDRLTESLRARVDRDVEVLFACAGQPTNLSALQRSVGDAQFLLAPAGTSVEDLRELAIQQTPGDIVRLLNGSLLDDSHSHGTERELSMTS